MDRRFRLSFSRWLGTDSIWHVANADLPESGRSSRGRRADGSHVRRGPREGALTCLRPLRRIAGPSAYPERVTLPSTKMVAASAEINATALGPDDDLGRPPQRGVVARSGRSRTYSGEADCPDDLPDVTRIPD